MVDLEEYQELKNSEYVDKDYKDVDRPEIDVYQVQAASKSARFQLVGSFSNTPSIMITRFKLQERIDCVLTSCFFSLDELRAATDINRFAMIKLLLNKKNGGVDGNTNNDVLKPFSCLMLNFISYDKIDRSNLDDKLNNVDVKGHWNVTYHFQNKMVILNKLPIFTDVSLMIEVMVDLLSDPIVQEEIARVLE